jgi:hypothetical protein
MRLALALLLFALVAPARAQEPERPDLPPQPEAERPKPLRESGAGGFGDGGDFGGGPFYRAEWYPQRPVVGQPTDLGMARHTLNLGTPLWRDRDAGQALIASLRFRYTHFDSAAVLPEGRNFPGELWNVTTGLTYAHTFANGWRGGASVQFGTASDKPFNSLREMTLGGVAFVKVPARRDPDSWTFGLAYFPNGQLNFPIPVIAYDWNPTDRLKVSIGVPFSIRWQPTDELLFQLSYRPLTQVNARATWTPHEWASVFAAFEWTNEGYFLAGRADRNDRFFGFEKRLLAGFTIYPHKRVGIEVSGGYAFDRVYGTGQTRSEAEDSGVEIGPGGFLSLAIRGRF